MATDSPAESWSFSSTRSFDDVTTPAVLLRDVPPAAESTLAATRTLVDSPAARSSSLQVTLRPETEHRRPSASGVPDTRSPDGRGSVRTTRRAVDGPAFDTRIV